MNRIQCNDPIFYFYSFAMVVKQLGAVFAAASRSRDQNLGARQDRDVFIMLLHPRAT